VRAAITIACALLATGCLLPDRSKLDRDGGADAGPDDGGGDAGDAGDAAEDGADAGDGSVCDVREQHERTCEGGEDEDCDGLVDCNDFDCGRDLGCCGAGGTATISDFTTGAFWTSLPTGVAPAIAPSGGVVADFYSSEPRATRFDSCLPVDLGIEVRALMRARGGACTAGTFCPYASLVLTPQSEMARGVPLADELSIRVYADGTVEARRAGRVLSRHDAPLGAGVIDVRVQLTPGIDDAGVAWVYAHVRVVSPDEEFVPWPELRALVPREDLIGAALGCEEARGLYLALEGQGDRVEFDSVTVDPAECANPSHFQRPSGGLAELDAASVGATPRWSSGGIGAPALGSYLLDGAPQTTWTLLYDATNVPRTNELLAPVRFSVGLSQTTRDDGVSDWSVRGDPLIGLDPPQCAGCMPSVREPTFLLPVEEDERGLPSSSSGWVVYAREVDGSGGRRFSLRARRLTASPIDTGSTEYELIVPVTGDAGPDECESLRDPLLLPMERESADEAWLIYSCERPRGVLREIRIARLVSDALGPRVEGLAAPLLTSTDFDPIAALTLRATDGVAWFVGEDLVIYRIWLATRDLMGRTAIAFAEASGSPAQPPVFEPYAANPVLRADDPLFGDCTTRDCAIDSVAVARTANSPHRIRLLVARTITTSTEVRHVLSPLDQVWPAPVP